MFPSNVEIVINEGEPPSDAYRWRVAIHEAGHAVADALWFEIPKRVTLCGNHRSDRGLRPPPGTDQTGWGRLEFEGLLAVLSAGKAAVRLFFTKPLVFNGEPEDEIGDIGYCGDEKSDCGFVCGAIEKAESVGIIIGRPPFELVAETEYFLREHKPLIKSIAARLYDNKQIDADELDDLLRPILGRRKAMGFSPSK